MNCAKLVGFKGQNKHILILKTLYLAPQTFVCRQPKGLFKVHLHLRLQRPVL